MIKYIQDLLEMIELGLLLYGDEIHEEKFDIINRVGHIYVWQELEELRNKNEPMS